MDEAKLARAMRRRGKETSEAERIENQRILDEYKNMGFPDTDIEKTDINWKPYSEGDANEPYQKGGLAQIKIDNGFIYDPKYDDPVEGYNRYCGGRLYCKTGYIPFGCHECIKIHSNSDDLDAAPPSISFSQMRRDSDQINQEINNMRTNAVSRRGGRRRRKTRRQRKSRRRQRKSKRAR
jgi:hypothetical protein